MLTRTAAIKAAGYRFLQKMYFRWRGSDSTEHDFLDNWVTCYLLNIAGNKTFWLTTADNKTVIAAPKNRCLTVSQFRPIYRKLVETGRLRDKTYKPVSQLQGDAEKIEAGAAAVRSLEEIIGAINLEGLNIRSLKVLRQEEKRAKSKQKQSSKNGKAGRKPRARRQTELDVDPPEPTSFDPIHVPSKAQQYKGPSHKARFGNIKRG
jgi:hypothetical protein